LKRNLISLNTLSRKDAENREAAKGNRKDGGYKTVQGPSFSSPARRDSRKPKLET
jgi:hypothetical protein